MSKKILVIDDESDVRTFLTTLLKKNGYQTVTAEDGVKGLAMARAEKPDLVSLDLMMPNNTGTDFYRKLSKDRSLSQTPVIVVSGLSGRHLAVKDPVAVFDKPIDPDVYLAAVRKALGEPPEEA